MLDDLARIAARTAMVAAAKYLIAQRHLDPTIHWNDAVVCKCIRANIEIRLPKALADARQALDANMAQTARDTFMAEMALAGIDGAKEAMNA